METFDVIERNSRASLGTACSVSEWRNENSQRRGSVKWHFQQEKPEEGHLMYVKSDTYEISRV